MAPRKGDVTATTIAVKDTAYAHMTVPVSPSGAISWAKKTE